MLDLPAPSYLHLRYIDWVRPYVNEVVNHLNLTEKKREEVLAKVSLCNLYLDDLERRKREMKVLVLGEIGEKELLQSLNSSCGDVQLNIYSVPVYVVESKPHGTGNHAFDDSLTNHRL